MLRTIAILCLRRLPWIMLLWKWIPAVPDRTQAIFTGWFGPIGVSAVCECRSCSTRALRLD